MSALGNGSGNAGTGSGGVLSALPALNQAGLGNIAGVLQYCMKNNYLGSGASSIADSLLHRAPGNANNAGYQEGAQGLLNMGRGQSYSLNGPNSMNGAGNYNGRNGPANYNGSGYNNGSGNPNNTVNGLKNQVTQRVCDVILQHARSLL